MNNHTPAGDSPVPGTHPPATARPSGGRRRAAPPLQGRRRADPSADGSSRHRGRKAALAVIASGVALTASLASAHATTPRATTLPQTQSAGTTAPAEYVPVAAAAGAQLNFERTEVSTSPAPAAPPPQETHAAETALPDKATAPPQGSVKAAPAPPQGSAKAAPAPGARLSSPVLNPVTNSPFGYRTNPLTGSAGELHTGQDFAAGCGTEVFSAGKGTVIEAGFSPYGGGNRIVIDHGNGLQTTYNHLETIGVKINQAVETGTRIGIAGTTGNSTGCHLHFEVIVNGQTVDPSAWL
ncbi:MULTISPECIES: M23 family metallopeptidase [Pseudarthrobacter]|uniref:M23 family metallopeptidase n=1 Tax=Pseudarthrobacter TaxID=1742993 RepID=UPI00217DB52C|nr:M23 family metallopeptidase [Pseudarthrobacter phenanthrenivorans]